jgi:hypothetical protein
VGSNVIDSSLNSGDLLGFFVRDFGLEFLFQRIGVGDFFCLDAKLFGNDFLDALFDGAHTVC